MKGLANFNTLIQMIINLDGDMSFSIHPQFDTAFIVLCHPFYTHGCIKILMDVFSWMY